MDRDSCVSPRMIVNSQHSDENSGDSVLETVVVVDCVQTGESSDLGLKDVDFGSNKLSIDEKERTLDHEIQNGNKNEERRSQIDAESDTNSNNPVHGNTFETVITIDSNEGVCDEGENTDSAAAKNGLKSVETYAEGEPKVKEENEAWNDSCSIYTKRSFDGEKVCRICHLSFDLSPVAPDNVGVDMGMIEIGCGCKDELGIAHVHCAEAWFKLKGNRFCEICGQRAKNVSGLWDSGLMDEWNDQRFMNFSYDPSERRGGCWRGQSFCNFLIACLVMAFMLPWFFRVNLF